MMIAPVLLMALVLGPAADQQTAATVSLSARSTAPWSGGQAATLVGSNTKIVHRVEASIRSGPQGSFRGVRPTRATAVVVGTVSGLVAGGLVGAALDTPCTCDSPGFAGFLIGAPLGGVVGAVASMHLIR